MSWRHEVNNDRREQEQLDALHILVEDATQDTERWLQADLLPEERVHVLAMQERLAELARIIARRQDRARSPKDNWEWSDAVTEVSSLLKKAWKVRANFVGKGLARLLSRLPPELPGWQPPLTSNEPSPPERLRLAREIAGERHNSGEAVGPTTNEKLVESSAGQNSVKSAQGVESKVADRRSIVNAYIEEVRIKTGKRITRKDIWSKAGYKNRTEFERWQRQDARYPNKAAEETFARILYLEKPHLK
jgi:hypothetical protein